MTLLNYGEAVNPSEIAKIRETDSTTPISPDAGSPNDMGLSVNDRRDFLPETIKPPFVQVFQPSPIS